MDLKIVEYLAGEIGERFGGSKGEKEAAEFVKEEMEKIGLETEFQPFKFLGWEPVKEPIINLIEPEERTIKAGTMLFSDDTPEGGVNGRLKYAGIHYEIEGMMEWPKYSIVDEEDNTLAYVVFFHDGPTISIPLVHMGRYWGRKPYALLGSEYYKKFKKWLDQGKDVKLSLEVKGKFMPDLTSQNVIGLKRGESIEGEEIIVCAHYDSAYGSPGANDNASGVEVMLKVAERLIDTRTSKNIRFIGYGAEEYFLYGSFYHVESLKEGGLLSKVRSVINLDMVGAGNTLTIGAEPESFKNMVSKTIKDSKYRDEFKIQEIKLRCSSDHWPFITSEIPAAQFELWPYDHYHQKTDTKEKIIGRLINNSTELVSILVEELSYKID